MKLLVNVSLNPKIVWSTRSIDWEHH